MELRLTVTSTADDDCPPRLARARQHTPRVWSLGDLKLLDEPLLGLFCSSRCDGDSIVQIYYLARLLRQHGIATISGFHSPMESECLQLLLRGRQPVVICPAHGLGGRPLPAEWWQGMTAGRLLALSAFEPRQRRITRYAAEQRNRLVALLSDRVLILHAAPGSRTARLARDLAEGGSSVFSLRTGAAPLSDKRIQTVSAEELIAVLTESPPTVTPRSETPQGPIRDPA